MFKQYGIYKNLFEEQKCNLVTISGLSYDEIYNTSYKIQKKEEIEELISLVVKPHFKDDEIERNNILTYFKNKVDELKKEPFSRQIVYTPTYQGNDKLAACLSLFQIVFRNNKVDLHVHVRSQHFENNFIYDNQTYCMIITQISNLLKREIGVIEVKIISLHKNI